MEITAKIEELESRLDDLYTRRHELGVKEQIQDLTRQVVALMEELDMQVPQLPDSKQLLRDSAKILVESKYLRGLTTWEDLLETLRTGYPGAITLNCRGEILFRLGDLFYHEEGEEAVKKPFPIDILKQI